MPHRANAIRRVTRIRLLAEELREKSQSNTDESRTRCRRIALEIIELLKAEDAYQRGLPASPPVSVPVPSRMS